MIDSIIPNYKSGPIHKTLATGAFSLCTLSLKGPVFGLLSKSCSSLISPILHKKFGTHKINEVVADIIGSAVVFGAIQGAIHYGIITTSMSLLSLTVITSLSIAVTFLSIKVVYVAITTLLFNSYESEKKLTRFANYCTQSLLSLLKQTKFLPNQENFKNQLTDPNGVNHKSYTLLEGLIVGGGAMFYGLFSQPPQSLEGLGAIIGLYLLILSIATVSVSAIILGMWVLGTLVKIISLSIDSEERKKFMAVVNWQLEQLDVIPTFFPFSLKTIDEIKKPESAIEDNCHLLNLPLEMIDEITSRIGKEKQVTPLLMTCRTLFHFGAKFRQDLNLNSPLVRSSFPGILRTFLKDFEQLKIPHAKMRAYSVKSEDPSLTGDLIQSIHRASVEGGVIIHDPTQPPRGGRAITAITPKDMGENRVVWGLNPPFVAIRIHYEPNEPNVWQAIRKIKQVEGVVLFHRCLKEDTQELWGMSHPNLRSILLAKDEKEMQSLFTHFKTMLESALKGSKDLVALPSTLS